MRLFGLTKDQLDLAKKYIERVFGKSTSNTEVFIFGSRATGKHRKYSDVDLAIRSKDKNLEKKIIRLKDLLEESELPQKFDLVSWDKIAPGYKKGIERDKIPFWSKKKPQISKWRICPTGEHWVRRHQRRLKTGTIVDRDGHCRKNPSGKELITAAEIDGIAELPIFKNTKIRPKRSKLGYRNEDKYDHLIAGWVAFWNDVFKVKPPLHPDYVKVLIASESSFIIKSDAKNKRKNIGKARGLVQLTDQTRRILKDQKGELKDHLIVLNKDEIYQPNQNIAAAVRWLFRKHETARARLKRTPTWKEVLMEYKGTLESDSNLAKKQRKILNSHLKSIGIR